MSVLVRCGQLALLLGLILAAPAAWAESSPAWTDPPVRGAAGSQGETEAKPASVKPETTAPSGTKPAEARSEVGVPGQGPGQDKADGKATGKASGKSAETTPPAAAPAIKAAPPRAAFQGISPYRRPLVRSWPVARAPALRARAVEARRPIVERRLARRDAARGWRRDVAGGLGYRPVGRVDPYDGRFEPAPRRRLAGWGGLIGDARAERMAQARAMGYRVMRLRTYEFPDGRQVRELAPLNGPDDLD